MPVGSPSAVLTLGLGSWGSVNELITLGYGIGAAVVLSSGVPTLREGLGYLPGLRAGKVLTPGLAEGLGYVPGMSQGYRQ